VFSVKTSPIFLSFLILKHIFYFINLKPKIFAILKNKYKKRKNGVKTPEINS